MKIENWNGYDIRFVEKDGEWWAVLKDVCDALELRTYHVKNRLEKDLVSNDTLLTDGGPQEMLIVSEFGIYETIFSSRKKEAKEFKKWVFEVIHELRKSIGVAGFEIFRMLDKEHQKEAMQRIKEGMNPVDAISYMKANTIANKAVSNKYGYPKMIKKGDMSPEMLKDREPILDDTVELMTAQKKFGLNISVAEQIYKRWKA